MNYSSHLAVAKNLLSAYTPSAPFHLYLKVYFKQNKKHGSRDRKLITTLCYNYYRLGFTLKDIPLEERILIGFFLCEHNPSEFLQSLKPEWNKIITKPIKEKLAIGNWQSEIDNIFPFKDELSDDIDSEKFNFSFLDQPKLFIRVRPGFNKTVTQKLDAGNIHYETVSGDCLALPNSSKIGTVIKLDKEAVVQDYNSQRIGEFIKLAIGNKRSEINVWDCCTASGGKSILAYDVNPSINLTVSDKRKSILENLQQRFAKAGISNYHSFVANLSGMIAAGSQISERKFNLIIADVPCTGSGTWARTPEQLFYFDQKQIKKYSDLQEQIVENIKPFLKHGGYLLYVTCSVFKKENEEVVDFIKEKLKINLVRMELLKGYEMQADTMFAALFVCP
ncbi:MAG: Fmu (Sun) domain-containing protein [Ginsengibacter sp.]